MSRALSSEPLSRLEIHVDHIRRNYLALQKMLVRGCDCAAVVKADAYGLGAAAVAPALWRENCRHFYVATAAEGLALRHALGDKEAHIYLLHGAGGADVADVLAARLVPVLNSLGDVAHWSATAVAAARKLPAVLHLDTGMNRLGLPPDEVRRLAAAKETLAPLDLRYVISHLACADEPAHPKNREQLATFKKYVAELALPARLGFANSAGVFLGPDYHFDQARPGCAIYGINPQPATANAMQGVVTLKAHILQIHEAQTGETVGYGASYRLAAPQRLATISAGYADGILRSAAERGMVYISGQACPLVGRVSMDLIVVNVTSLSVPPQVGDWAEIVGAHHPVDVAAAEAGTIGYEILTSLGSRYTRVYTGQDS